MCGEGYFDSSTRRAPRSERVVFVNAAAHELLQQQVTRVGGRRAGDRGQRVPDLFEHHQQAFGEYSLAAGFLGSAAEDVAELFAVAAAIGGPHECRAQIRDGLWIEIRCCRRAVEGHHARESPTLELFFEGVNVPRNSRGVKANGARIAALV